MNKTFLQPQAARREKQIHIVDHLPKIDIERLQEEIRRGLNAKPKYISSKFFYDKNGSELFEAITRLEEYYPTRTEKQILTDMGDSLNIRWQGLNIIELGSGDHSKIRLLLQQIPTSDLATISYSAVDISASALEKAAKNLAQEFPMITIGGIVADFNQHLKRLPKADSRLFCFFGSTIGNLNRREIRNFLQQIGAVMQNGDHFLLGMDMIKDRVVLERAYNDGQQITAAFNKNILNVVNQMIHADFEPDNFNHLAFYNEAEKRIEMHLEAAKDMVINCADSAEKFYLKQGETIHTENSHKFTRNDIDVFAVWAGLKTVKIFSDERQWFSLVHYKK